MTLTAKSSSLLLAGSIVLAAIVDRVLIAPNAPAVSNVLLVKPGIVLFGVPVLPDALFGVLPLVAVPLIVLSVGLIPVKSLRDRHAWSKAWQTGRGLAIAMVLITPLMILGGFLYALIKGYLPDATATFAESFGFKPTLFIGSKDTTLVGPFDGSLACLVGLIGGLWLAQKWLRK